MMETKNPIKSKTINGNIIASALLIALPHFGIAITPEISIVIMGIGNILLRFISKSPIGLKASSLESKIVILYKAYQKLKEDVEKLKNEQIPK